MKVLRKSAVLFGLCLLSCSLLVSACGDKSSAQPEHQAVGVVAVSTSWLECCVRDLAGTDLDVLRLTPPGACPGHSDIRPGAVSALRECQLAILFGFQEAMGEKIRSVSPETLRVVALDYPGGLSVPESYRKGCRDVCAAMSEIYPDKGDAYAEALASVESRMDALESEAREQVEAAGLAKTCVIASGHQALFCQWLGLDTVATYTGPTKASPAQIDELLSKGAASGVRFVVANLQEGTQAAEALGEQLDAPVVVFSNFPAMDGGQDSFDSLVRANVDHLLQAAKDLKSSTVQ